MTKQNLLDRNGILHFVSLHYRWDKLFLLPDYGSQQSQFDATISLYHKITRLHWYVTFSKLSTSVDADVLRGLSCIFWVYAVHVSLWLKEIKLSVMNLSRRLATAMGASHRWATLEVTQPALSQMLVEASAQDFYPNIVTKVIIIPTNRWQKLQSNSTLQKGKKVFLYF